MSRSIRKHRDCLWSHKTPPVLSSGMCLLTTGWFKQILRDHEAHITFDGCTFKGGLATSDRGGGVCIETQNSHNTTVSIIDSTFDSNNATKSGGGLYIFNLKTFTISGTHIASNNAIDSGGGMYTSVSMNFLGLYCMPSLSIHFPKTVLQISLAFPVNYPF